MKNSVFFNKVNINENTKNVTLYVTSAPRETTKIDFLGMQGGMRVQDKIINGQLNMLDETGKSLKSNHPVVKKIRTLEPGAELPGFRINTDAPVLDLQTGEPLRNLYWVEAAQ